MLLKTGRWMLKSCGAAKELRIEGCRGWPSALPQTERRQRGVRHSKGRAAASMLCADSGQHQT